MYRMMAWVASALFLAGVAQADQPIVPSDTKLTKRFTRTAAIRGGLTEGPAVAPDGSIYFSDIPFGPDKGQILRYDPRTRTVSVFTADSGMANGLVFDADGHLIACEGADGGGRRIVRWDLSTKVRRVVADRFKGKRFNAPNDLCIDFAGRIYFTDPRYIGAEPRELEHRAVYRIDRDGTVSELTHSLEKPNGIAISPDGRTIYIADTNNGTDRIVPGAPPAKLGAMKVYAFSLSDKGEVDGERRLLVDFGDRIGCDGMTVDEQGNVYLSVRDAARPGVLIVDPQGKEIGFVPTGPAQADAQAPLGIPSNCVFGRGVERKRLYVTVDQSLYSIDLNVAGFRVPTSTERRLAATFAEELVDIDPGKPGFPKQVRLGEEDGGPNALGARSVSFEMPFRIARYEVPQNLWQAVMGSNPSRWKGPRNSVEELSFHEAVVFCESLTQILRSTGEIPRDHVVRLPTEAEWEYCARAGTSTRYSFGDAAAELGEYAWFTGNAKGNDPPVGVKKPNAWGLYDVHGYLWEWCQDDWQLGNASVGVLRGGSWKDRAEKLTSAYRQAAPRSLRDDAVGLRCVVVGARKVATGQ